MAPTRKLQVFVSSTYTDLKAERQAAVEAILTAGHIPAGMELFAAGDQSQINAIKRWIDESDVFLLILGGRYGSLEPTSGKSYIQLEYEHAVQQNRPLFAVVVEDAHLEERVKTLGRMSIETDNPQLLKQFRAVVLTKLVRFWSDPKDIKLAVLETLSDFNRRPDLVGWIPGSEAVNSPALAEEIARLGKENAALREQLGKSSGPGPLYGGLSFEDLYQVLTREKIETFGIRSGSLDLEHVATAFGDAYPAAVHVFWVLREKLFAGEYNIDRTGFEALFSFLEQIGLVHRPFPVSSDGTTTSVYSLTGAGRELVARLIRERPKAVLWPRARTDDLA